MYGLRWWCVGWLAACTQGLPVTPDGSPNPGVEQPVQAPSPADQARGWLPAESTESAPLTVEKAHWQPWQPDRIALNARGTYLTFRVDTNICHTRSDTGSMDSDLADPKGGEVVDTIGDAAVVASGHGVRLIGPGTRETLVDVPTFDAVVTSDAVAYVTEDCMLEWVDGAPLDLTLRCAAVDNPLVAAEGGVLALGDGIWFATPEAATLLDAEPAEYIAYDESTAMVAAVRGSVVSGLSLDGDAPGWTVDLGTSVVLDLMSNPSVGVFAIERLHEGDRVVEMLDSATGEWLGTLDLRDGAEGIASAQASPTLASLTPRGIRVWALARPPSAL